MRRGREDRHERADDDDRADGDPNDALVAGVHRRDRRAGHGRQPAFSRSGVREAREGSGQQERGQPQRHEHQEPVRVAFVHPAEVLESHVSRSAGGTAEQPGARADQGGPERHAAAAERRRDRSGDERADDRPDHAAFNRVARQPPPLRLAAVIERVRECARDRTCSPGCRQRCRGRHPEVHRGRRVAPGCRAGLGFRGGVDGLTHEPLLADRRLAEDPPQAPAQHLDVVVPARVGELAGIAARERAQAARQLSLGRHRRAVHQNRDDLDVGPLERALDLAPDEILGVVEPAPVAVLGARPARPDHDDADLRGVHHALDVLDEVHARLDRHVAKDPLLAEAVLQITVQLPRPAGRVGAPVVDEDPRARHGFDLAGRALSRCSLTHAVCSVDTRASTRSASNASGSAASRYAPARER